MFSFKRNPMKFRSKIFFSGVLVFLVSIIFPIQFVWTGEDCSYTYWYEVDRSGTFTVRDHRTDPETTIKYVRYTQPCPEHNEPELTLDVDEKMFAKGGLFHDMIFGTFNVSISLYEYDAPPPAPPKKFTDKVFLQGEEFTAEGNQSVTKQRIAVAGFIYLPYDPFTGHYDMESIHMYMREGQYWVTIKMREKAQKPKGPARSNQNFIGNTNDQPVTKELPSQLERDR